MSEPSAIAAEFLEGSPKPSLSVSDRLAVSGAALFVVMLAVAAYWDPGIRVLHSFEAVPYLLAATLIITRRRYGYVLGVAAAMFWLWTAGFLTTFIKNGFERLITLVQTGHVDRWDVFIAVPAALGTGALLVFSGISYFRSANKSRLDALAFLGTMAAVAVFFILLFRMFAPQYLGMFGTLLPDVLRPKGA